MVKKIKIYCFLETYFNKYAMTDSWIIISGTLNSHIHTIKKKYYLQYYNNRRLNKNY